MEGSLVVSSMKSPFWIRSVVVQEAVVRLHELIVLVGIVVVTQITAWTLTWSWSSLPAASKIEDGKGTHCAKSINMNCKLSEEVDKLVGAVAQTPHEDERCEYGARDVFEEEQGLQLVQRRKLSTNFIAMQSILPRFWAVVGISNDALHCKLRVPDFVVFIGSSIAAEYEDGSQNAEPEERSSATDLESEEKIRIPHSDDT